MAVISHKTMFYGSLAFAGFLGYTYLTQPTENNVKTRDLAIISLAGAIVAYAQMKGRK